MCPTASIATAASVEDFVIVSTFHRPSVLYTIVICIAFIRKCLKNALPLLFFSSKIQNNALESAYRTTLNQNQNLCKLNAKTISLPNCTPFKLNVSVRPQMCTGAHRTLSHLRILFRRCIYVVSTRKWILIHTQHLSYSLCNNQNERRRWVAAQNAEKWNAKNKNMKGRSVASRNHLCINNKQQQ